MRLMRRGSFIVILSRATFSFCGTGVGWLLTGVSCVVLRDKLQLSTRALAYFWEAKGLLLRRRMPRLTLQQQLGIATVLDELPHGPQPANGPHPTLNWLLLSHGGASCAG